MFPYHQFIFKFIIKKKIIFNIVLKTVPYFISCYDTVLGLKLRNTVYN